MKLAIGNLNFTARDMNWKVKNQNFITVKILTVMLLFLSNVSLLAQNIEISASIDRNPVGLHEVFTYQLEVSGSMSKLPNLRLPNFEHFKRLSGPNESSSFQIINGAVSASKTYSVQLLPKEIGTFDIPAISISYQGKTYQSNTIKVTVVEEGQQSNRRQRSRQQRNQDSAAAADDLFIRTIPSKRSVYVNELFNVSYKVYFRISIQNPDIVKLPETVGFWVEEYEIPSNIPVTREVINGIQYNVAEVKRLALFPTKAGELTLTPMQLALNVVERRNRGNPFGMFDSFFNDPFGRAVRKVLNTRPIKINVKPLPENRKPVDFSGLVGNFQASFDLDKTSVKANEAISYKIRLSGSGNLKALKAIPIEFPANFEVYDPKVKDNVNRSGQNFSASRELEYVLIPRVSGEYHLKPIKISFFNPIKRSYETIRSPEYTIKVGVGKETASLGNNTFLSKSEVKLLGKDIHFIKEEDLNLLAVDYKPYQTSWFWISLVLPLIFFSIAYGYRGHLEKMTTNVEYARKRKAFKQADYRLKEAKQFLKKRYFAEFYSEVSKALIGFVADKTNHSAAGLLREDVEIILKNNKVDTSMIHEYTTCLDEADFRRFAPGQTSEEAAQSFYQWAAKVLAKLGKYF